MVYYDMVLLPVLLGGQGFASGWGCLPIKCAKLTPIFRLLLAFT